MEAIRQQKIAVVGCGYWGKNLVRNFSELNSLKYICDSDSSLAKNIANQYDLQPIGLKDLFKTDIEGVVIAAPAAQHFELTRMALEAGKHVFVEKPLALKVEEAETLCSLASQQSKVLMVGHLLQYHAAFSKLKTLVTEGTLGKLQYIYSNRLNLGKFRNEENILWSFAPHDISMILGLAGDVPETVLSTGSAHLNNHIQDVTITHLAFKSGIRAHVFVSWLHPFKEQKLVVVGDNGMAVFDDGLDWSHKLRIYPHQVHWINGLPEPQKAEFEPVELTPEEPLKAECDHFLDCIRTGKTPRTDGREGLNVLSVLDASQRSLVKGKMIFTRDRKDQQKLFFAHETACIDEGCNIGKGTKIWHYTHILGGTKIGENCNIGQNVMIGPDVDLGNNCKIQNNVSIYKGVTLDDGVFCGPSCVFTNVNNPRADVERKDEFLSTEVAKGVTIGANATIVCGNKLGAFSLIGAGAVITKDVKPHAIMVGNPAKQLGWISHSGEKLDENLTCPRDGRKYRIDEDGNLQELEVKHTTS